MSLGSSTPAAPLKRPPRVATIIAAIIAVLLFFGPMLVGMYTDWRWFGAIEYRNVFTTAIIARIVLFIIFGLIAAAVVWAAGYFAWRGRPDSLDLGDLNSPVYQYRKSIEKSMGIFFKVIPAIVGVIAGFIGQSNWRTVLLFLNGQEFGEQDAQFHHDLGFYAFTLPVLKMVVSTLSILLILAFLIALFGHYVLGGIRIGNKLSLIHILTLPTNREV